MKTPIEEILDYTINDVNVKLFFVGNQIPVWELQDLEDYFFIVEEKKTLERKEKKKKERKKKKSSNLPLSHMWLQKSVISCSQVNLYRCCVRGRKEKLKCIHSSRESTSGQSVSKKPALPRGEEGESFDRLYRLFLLQPQRFRLRRLQLLPRL